MNDEPSPMNQQQHTHKHKHTTMSNEQMKAPRDDNGSGNSNPVIVGLDIGTTKIAAIAGRKNEYGKLEILGFGRANSNGVQHGMVLNIDQTIKAIEMALKNCA